MGFPLYYPWVLSYLLWSVDLPSILNGLNPKRNQRGGEGRQGLRRTDEAIAKG
jgi:hypothetical protein